MSWLSLVLLALFGGIVLWLVLNAEARVLVRELGRYGLYRLALILQSLSGRPIGYVQSYKDSVARDAGLNPSEKQHNGASSQDPQD